MILRALLLLAVCAGACRRAPAPPPPAPPDQRGELLQRILALDEVAPCLAEVGAAGVHLVDAELAGEVAMAAFVCDNGAVKGRVTFFRIGGGWQVSTKEISKQGLAPEARDR
jgi:hypothetical protein